MVATMLVYRVAYPVIPDIEYNGWKIRKKNMEKSWGFFMGLRMVAH